MTAKEYRAIVALRPAETMTVGFDKVVETIEKLHRLLTKIGIYPLPPEERTVNTSGSETKH